MRGRGKQIIYFGLFIFFIGLSLFVPNLNSMLLNLYEAKPNIRTLFQYSFLVIAFGFLFSVVLSDE